MSRYEHAYAVTVQKIGRAEVDDDRSGILDEVEQDRP
jgi:hypothetical protein